MTPTLTIPPQGAFNTSNAHQCALACLAIYDAAGIVTADAHANVIDCGNAILVVFRGTKNIRDLITDVSAWRANIEGTMIHKGFYASVSGIIGAVKQAIDNLQARAFARLPVMVAGHSLGGAQAMLAAYRLKCTGYRVDSVYTFGQPRVGNRAFVDNYDPILGSRTFRVTNGADIVPWVPWLLGSYYHAGQEEFMPSNNGGLVENPGIARKLVTNGLELYREMRRGKQAELEDHHMENYLANLGLLLNVSIPSSLTALV